MVRRTQTFSIRLAVEDGNKVKAVFVGVGKEGEKAFKKIETGSKKASGGLGSLTKRARSLSRNIKLLGVAAAAVATVGGLAVLTKKAIDSASALGKSADQIGVNVEALQELRFAAKTAGVEQDRFDTGLKTFTKRVAEAARGSGKAKDALEAMGITLRDNNGNIRDTETLLDDVADALKNTEDPTTRLRLAFKLFDSEGAAFVKILGKGSTELEKTKQRARDLGIVLEEDLIRDAEKAKDELEILSKVVSANLSRALLGLAPLIADTSSLLAELAADAGNAYEKMLLIFQGDFAFENQSLRGLNQDLKNLREEIEKIDADLARRRALQTQGGLGALFGGGTEVDIIFHEKRRADIVERIAETEKRINAIRAERQALEEETPTGQTEADEQALLKQEQELQNLVKSLDKQLFDLTTKGAERIRVEADLLVEQIENLKDIASNDEIAGLIKQVREIESLQLAEFTEKQAEADERAAAAAKRRADAEEKKKDNIRKANEAIVEGLQNEITALGQSERQNFIDQAVRRLSAEATETQRIEVERLAAALFDEREAAEEVRKEHEREAQLIENITNLTEEQTSAQAKYNKEIAELNRLRKEEKITAQQLAAAEEDARRRMLAASRRWIDGVERALRDYADQATDSARQAEQVTLNFLRNAEDAFVEFTRTGKFEFRDLLNSIVADINRALVQQNITGPLAQGLNNIIGSIDFGSLFSGSAKGNVFNRGAQLETFATGGVVNRPTVFPMTNGIGLMGEAGPEAILPLRRLPSGKLGVESTGNPQPMFMVNVDARGSTDPGATAAQVEQAVDRALNARIPGIVRASSTTAKSEVIDAFQRRGGRFD